MKSKRDIKRGKTYFHGFRQQRDTHSPRINKRNRLHHEGLETGDTVILTSKCYSNMHIIDNTTQTLEFQRGSSFIFAYRLPNLDILLVVHWSPEALESIG